LNRLSVFPFDGDAWLCGPKVSEMNRAQARKTYFAVFRRASRQNS
jgi:hypothetical protein